MQHLKKLYAISPLLLIACGDPILDAELGRILNEGALWPSPGESVDEPDQNTNNPWADGILDQTGNATGGSGPVQSADVIAQGGEPGREEEGDPGGAMQEAEQPSAQPERASLGLTEYKEGLSGEKLLLISNRGPSGEAECSVQVYSNGGLKPWRNMVLPLRWEEGESLALCTASEIDERCSHPIPSSNFNGNDAVVVQCEEGVVDSLGRIGEDPGDAWWAQDGQMSYSTKDTHLLRCPGSLPVLSGDYFDLAEQWKPWLEGETKEESLRRCSPSEGLGGAGGGSLSG